MHKRSEIKAKFKELLLREIGGQYQTIAGERVFVSRFVPIAPEELPAITIYAIEESNEPKDSFYAKRSCKVVVECLASGEDAEQKVDELSGQVENILIEEETLEGIVDKIFHTQTAIYADEEAKSDIMSAVLTYEVTYGTRLFATVPGETLNTANVSFGDASTDEINLPQE